MRLVISPPLDGATNMALDHALARLAGAGNAPPTLRLYRWQPACVSIGYFQSINDVDRAECAARGFDLVRRPTGGRAILHDAELTYAVTGSAKHPKLRGKILDAYASISQALVTGLRQLVPDLAWSNGDQHHAKSAACFDTPSDYEITVTGKKLVGSAQTRTNGGVLQHGTILLHADVAALTAVLNLPETINADALAERMIALDQASNTPVTFDQTAQALIAGFEQAWNVTFEHGDITPDEWALAEELRAQRYANEAWLSRR